MPLRQGTLFQIERGPNEIAVAPRRVYIESHPTIAGRYLAGTSSSSATAFLGASSIASATGRHLLYSTVAEETRALYLATETIVIG